MCSREHQQYLGHAGENNDCKLVLLDLYHNVVYQCRMQGEDGGGESGDDEEEEDGFFVPHGYLSDSEGDHSGDEAMQGQDNHVKKNPLNSLLINGYNC